jgi:hypothetical protein
VSFSIDSQNLDGVLDRDDCASIGLRLQFLASTLAMSIL